LIRQLLALPLCAVAVYFAIVTPRIGPLVQKNCAILLLAAFFSFGIAGRQPCA
jgi:hypothetical protein